MVLKARLPLPDGVPEHGPFVVMEQIDLLASKDVLGGEPPTISGNGAVNDQVRLEGVARPPRL
jgi:hypothetical protein